MTEQTIGTARLDLVVTTDKLDAAVESAKRSVSSMSAAAQAEYNKLNAAEKRRVDSYLKQAQSISMTRQEQILFNAALKGTPTHILDELKTKLASSGASAQGLTKAFSGTNKSARELQFAMRGLPAQVTDIVTSLASGQRPLMVLLQQGGQLKDMFGGVAPAVRALGGAVLGFVNPVTLAITAVAGLGLALKTALDETQAFNLAIIQTGGHAGHTAEDLAAMAKELDSTTSATQRFASTVIAQVEATGRFTGDQVKVISTAITNMAKATELAGGDADAAIKDLIKSFSDLSKDPVEALLKLNETQHFLTESTLKQVQSLVAQGKEAEAAEVAINALADTTNTRAKQMEGSINSASAAWGGMKSAIAETADEVVGFFRTADAGLQQFIRSHQGAVQALAKLQTFPLLPFGGAQSSVTQSLLDNANAANFSGVKGSVSGAGLGVVDSAKARRDIKAVEDAQREWNSSIQQGETAAQRLKRELDEVAKAGKRLGKSDADIKAAQDALRIAAQKKGPKGRSDGIESANSRAAIQAFEDELKKEQGLLANQKQILEANYAARNVLTAEYYSEQKRLAQENTTAQVAALEGEIRALQSRSLKGKDSINNARELAEKEAQLAKVRADGATALEVLNIQEAAQIKQRQQANIAYQDALDQGKEALKAELDSQVLRIQVGEREFEIRSRIIQLYRDEAKELLNLARQRDAGEIDPETYKARVEQLKAAIADEVKIVREGYDAMAEAQKNWVNGAKKALADYRDAANDVAGQTYSLFSNAIGGLEDVFTDFITKGNGDWRGFLDGLYEEAVRMTVRQGLNKVLSKFMPSDSESSNAEALSGAAASLAASAAPLYGAAAALSASAAALTAAGAGSAVTGGSEGFSWAGALAAVFGGGRASGGPVSAGRLYEVGEGNRPELLNVSGRSFLIPGNNGNVAPLAANDSRGDIHQTNYYRIEGPMSRQAREAARYDNARNLNRAQRRNG